MAGKLSVYDPRQEMLAADFEIQHKRDTYLKDVELHHHDFYEIYYLVSGDVTYVIEGRLCRVLPGDLLLISPQELHQVSITPGMEPYERYVLWIDRAAVRRLSSPGTDLERHLDPTRQGYTNLLRLTREQRQALSGLLDGCPLVEEGPPAVYRLTESQRQAFVAELDRQDIPVTVTEPEDGETSEDCLLYITPAD